MLLLSMGGDFKMEKYKCSKTEDQIMDFLWENNGSAKTNEIFRYFNDEENQKNWKRQTLNTLLIRLEEKDLIIRTRGQVVVKHTKEELQYLECRKIVSDKFNGSLIQFLKVYIGNDTISNDDATEIIDTIKSLM